MVSLRIVTTLIINIMLNRIPKRNGRNSISHLLTAWPTTRLAQWLLAFTLGFFCKVCDKQRKKFNMTCLLSSDHLHLEYGLLWCRFRQSANVLIRCLVVQTRMRTDLIVLLSPCFDNNARLCACSKPFHVQTFVSELAVEAFIKTVLPRFTRVGKPLVS